MADVTNNPSAIQNLFVIHLRRRHGNGAAATLALARWCLRALMADKR
jgi:hypothetical protein